MAGSILFLELSVTIAQFKKIFLKDHSVAHFVWLNLLLEQYEKFKSLPFSISELISINLPFCEWVLKNANKFLEPAHKRKCKNKKRGKQSVSGGRTHLFDYQNTMRIAH